MADTRTRIIGQDIQIVIVYNGTPYSFDVKSAEITANLKTLEEGYLGETVNRFDDNLEGYSGRIDFDLEDESWMQLVSLLAQRAQSRDPSIKVNITMRATFPNKTSVRIMLSDLYFDNLPLTIGKRDEFVKQEFNFKSSFYQILL